MQDVFQLTKKNPNRTKLLHLCSPYPRLSIKVDYKKRKHRPQSSPIKTGLQMIIIAAIMLDITKVSPIS